MKTSLATMLSVTGVLAAGALAFTVNTSVLDNAVTTAEAAPALQADVIAAGVEPTVAAQSTYNIDGVATITLSLDANSLSVVSVTPVSGYTFITTTKNNSRIAVALTLGDSVMKGAAPALADLGIVVDAVQDRQGKMGADIFVQLKELGVTMDAAVVHLGTNGPMSQETLDTMMQALSEVPRVVVLTSKAYRDWTDSNNEKIRALPATYPNVTVLDWQLVATLCAGNCLTADGIHLGREGIDYYVQEIWKALGR